MLEYFCSVVKLRKLTQRTWITGEGAGTPRLFFCPPQETAVGDSGGFEAMVNKNSKRRADRRVVRTGGTVFPDGTILEPIATAGNSERLRLAMWSGTRTRVGSEFEHGGQLYEPAALDPTILKALFLPTHVAPAEPARQLLGDMGRVLVTYTGFADRCVTLFTRFSLATFFAQNFSMAPWLAIVGPDPTRRMQLIQLLRCFCWHALPIFDPNVSLICALPREWHFTFLIQQPNLSRQAQRFLHATSRRGGYVLRQGRLLDVYSPCVVLADDPCELSNEALPAIEIPAIPDLPEPALLTDEGMRKIAAEFQPRLLAFFFANNSKVRGSAIDVGALSFSMREVARNLAACTPDDVSLQMETLKALREQDDATRVARWTDENSVLLESLLSFCHDARDGAYIGEIADTTQYILAERGAPGKLNAKAVGARLRLMQFRPEPRDRVGYRLKFTDGALRLMHRLAFAHNVPAVQNGIARCKYCRDGRNPAGAVGTASVKTT